MTGYPLVRVMKGTPLLERPLSDGCWKAELSLDAEMDSSHPRLSTKGDDADTDWSAPAADAAEADARVRVAVVEAPLAEVAVRVAVTEVRPPPLPTVREPLMATVQGPNCDVGEEVAV